MDAQVTRRLLEAERERLLQLRRGVEAELPRGPESESTAELSALDQHQADAASELFGREMDLSIVARVDTELRDVDDALDRLERGTYGSCQVCRAPIPDNRLEAVPATPFCLDHESQREGSEANAHPDSSAFADDIAAREGTHHLEFLPTDDEEDEDLQLGPEERAIHLTDPGAGGRSMAMTPNEVEQAEDI
jgi:RNA polymerase-binding transcription factor DksA